MALSIEKRFSVDLDKPLNVQYGGGLMFTGDAGADTFEVTLYKSGEAYAPGGSVALNCIRADGNTVTVAGSISGNVATATLTQACCAIPGPLSVVMQIISGGNTGAVFAAAYTVMPAQTGEPIDPGTTIPDIAALIAQIDAAVDSIPADYSDLLAAIAPTFSASTAYAAGDYVWYEGDMYKFTAAHSASAWTGSDTAAAVFATDIAELKSETDQMKGFNDQTKAALLALLQKCAFVDDDAQDYFDALEDALYHPAVLVSISAEYTQPGIVYDTDPLDSLRSGLIVTAHYSNNKTAVVESYSLSGILAEGTSTITVSYSSMTTTFSVTVTEMPYPLENGTHTFSTNSRVLTVTNGRCIRYDAPNATASWEPTGAYLNLSKVSENDNAATNATNINKTTVLFTIPAGATVTFEILNIEFIRLDNISASFAFGLRNQNTTAISSGNIDAKDDVSVTTLVESDTPITCVMAYIRNQYKMLEAEIRLTVNGERWI